MSALKSKIVSLFKSRKLNVFFLFFSIAFTILILTKLSKTYTGTISFNITPTHVDDGYVLVNKKENTLKVTLETYGFKWLKYALNQPEIEVNFKEDITRKDSLFIWTSAKGFSTINDQFNIDEKIKSINPDTLFFKFDVNAVKLVPVLLDVKIDYSQGYNTLDKIKPQPDSVKIIGPASLLKNINSITSKKRVISNLTSNLNTSIDLQTDSLNTEIKISQKQVNLKIEVSKFTEGIVNVPIEIINIPNNVTVNYFPKEVIVSYSTSLENYKNIAEQNFKVICDFNDSKTNSFLIPSLTKQPESVINTRIQQQKIEFVITK